MYMTYWPVDWECMIVFNGGNHCRFYDPDGVNGQCGRPEGVCLFSDNTTLYQLKDVDMSGLEGSLISEEITA